MRNVFAGVFIVLIVALAVCAAIASRSKRPVGKSVSLLLASLAPPLAGNLLITLSDVRIVSLIGCYFYFIGINLVMFALLRFTFAYCEVSPERKKYGWVAYILLIMDAVSILGNILFHHAFGLELIMVDGDVYYRFVPFLWQQIHRAIDYGIFVTVLVIFITKLVRTARVYLEKYLVVFLALIVFSVWQTYYVFSRTPVDRSMIGYGLFGLLVFYFSIVYRPTQLLDRMLATMVSGMPEALLFFDRNLECIWANEKAMALFKVGKRELPKVRFVLFRIFGEPADRSEEWDEQKWVELDGEMRSFLIHKQNVRDAKGREAGVFMSIRDNTEEIKALETERYNVMHDSVTGLLNKEYLFKKVKEELAAHPERNYCISIASIDDFEAVQDVYGMEFGEHAIKQITQWIGVGIPDGSVCGRLGDSEFGSLVVSDQVDMPRIQHDLSHQVVRAGEVDQHIFIHFGIYEVEDRNLDVSIMFDRARLALSSVRDSMTNYVGFYDKSLRDDKLWNQMISAELPAALAAKEIVPYLQPIMDASGKLQGAEVLARWNHPREGFLSPSEFIPVFEKNGLIAEIDRYMWRCACEILSEWQREGRDLFLSVNISPKDFEVIDIVAEIRGLIHEYGIDLKKLRLEITESAMGINQKSRMEVLKNLREDGFFVEMDDFGSGYSSMNLMKDMPLDLVKLDMAFLQDSEDVERARIIVQMIIALAHELGIISLMEGVETEHQYQALVGMGCEYFQGYYFSKPVSLPQFLEELK